MYILDKNKDYYDYLAKLYGVDKTITYDHRGSITLTELTFLKKIAPSYDEYENKHYFEDNKKKYLFIVEVGTTQYLFKMYDIHYKLEMNIYSPCSCKYELLRIFKDNKHYYEKEITIVPVSRNRYYIGYNWRDWNNEKVVSFLELRELLDRRISNPILKDTVIPAHIKDVEVWKDLSNYISSKYNDKTITIKNSDVSKLQNHGFDKVTSFRHPIR